MRELCECHTNYTCACDITHDGRNDILLVDYSDPILYMTNLRGLYLITEDGNAYRFGEKVLMEGYRE